MSKVSMLVVVTPDGRSHGQRLSEDEAVALVRRLMELRGQAAPDAAPAPEAPRRRRPGGGRKRVWLVGDELERARELAAGACRFPPWRGRCTAPARSWSARWRGRPAAGGEVCKRRAKRPLPARGRSRRQGRESGTVAANKK